MHITGQTGTTPLTLTKRALNRRSGRGAGAQQGQQQQAGQGGSGVVAACGGSLCDKQYRGDGCNVCLQRAQTIASSAVVSAQVGCSEFGGFTHFQSRRFLTQYVIASNAIDSLQPGNVDPEVFDWFEVEFNNFLKTTRVLVCG
ncbi:unnamed protein product [Vitrella brassicaformis CCMP3155]|uniref:Uncharacterized protein n=1 Tax=Vitrella brassicaformis (strain CCMP3155) TaxID=1169540 RepID=A0A0G4E8Z2_VITBC|nr:unnamed protein product [Vitrella brassicaformis CCMP3155]|eukprot:CEL91671.1 unnamed protein product [Vitrella brassicaformis CCMP3155]